MQELFNTLKEKAGLSEEQATSAIEAIKNFIETKMPANMGGMVTHLFNNGGVAEEHSGIMGQLEGMVQNSGFNFGDITHKTQDIMGSLESNIGNVFGHKAE